MVADGVMAHRKSIRWRTPAPVQTDVGGGDVATSFKAEAGESSAHPVNAQLLGNRVQSQGRRLSCHSLLVSPGMCGLFHGSRTRRAELPDPAYPSTILGARPLFSTRAETPQLARAQAPRKTAKDCAGVK